MTNNKQPQAWWESETHKELDRLYGQSQCKVIPLPRQRAQQGMTPVRAVLQPVEQVAPPASLFWTCEACGLIAPYQIPVSGRWIRRSCACERSAREREREEESQAEWKAAQVYRTFGGWLGAGSSEAKLAECTFASYKRTLKWQQEAWKQVTGWFAGMRGNVMLHGSYGTGKTHLAAAICNALRERRVTSLFVSGPKYFATRNDLIKHEGDVHGLDRLAISTPLLVLDDADKAHHTDSRQEVYWLLVDERAKAGRPTVVTCNDMGGLVATMGQATFSRLMVGVQSVEMTGKDWRAK